MPISWTKNWSSSDDGSIVRGVDLKNLQDDIDAGIGDATTIHGFTFTSPASGDDQKGVYWDNGTSSFSYKEFVDLTTSQTIAGDKTFSDDLILSVSSLFKLGTANQGDVLYDDGTSFVRLTPGTSGQIFQTQGAGAAPQWADLAPNISSFVVTAGDVEHAASDAEVISTPSVPSPETEVKCKEIRVPYNGTYRITFDFAESTHSGGSIGFARVYRNGSQDSSRYEEPSTTYQSVSYDMSGVSAGDLIQIYASNNTPSNGYKVRNFKIKAAEYDGYDVIT